MAKRFESLDGMRGLCAIFVAVFHFDMVLKTGHFLNHGWLSVDIFFVLSGFVIALTYEERLRAGAGLLCFLAARGRRLIPTHIVGTSIVGLSYFALLWSGRLTPPAITASALLLALIYGLLLIPIAWSRVAPAFAPWNTGFPINPPLWSLQGEWVINILYGKWLYSMGTGALLAVFVAASIYLLYMVFLTSGGPGWLGVLPDIARASVGFIAGVMIFRMHSTGRLKRLPKVRPVVIYAGWHFILRSAASRPPADL